MRLFPSVRRALAALLVLNLVSVAAAFGGDSVSLAGAWTFALDRRDEGLAALTRAFPPDRGEVWLPGSVQAQGFGDAPTWDSPWVANKREAEWARPEYDAYRDPEGFKMPFWLQPERVYVGAAVFERRIEIPRAWLGKRVRFSMERVHWVSEAWLGDRSLGRRESLSVPHVYDLGVAGTAELPVGEHTLSLRIDNRLAYGVGPNAHSVSDHTQGNWNGAVGRIELVAEPLVSIARVDVIPDVESRSARVVVEARNETDQGVTVRIEAAASSTAAPGASGDVTVAVAPRSSGTFSIELDLGRDAALWSEFTPDVYRLAVTLDGGGSTDRSETSFGLREIGARDGRFTINGAPTFLRGTLDCLIYPRTGYAPMDGPSWERVFRRVKEFGLNHVRYHSWCPPKAAFEAADRLGVYLQVEGPFWTNQGPQLGLGQPIDGYVYEETDRILEAYGNHPSFVLMAYGNEPNGPERGGRFLREWLEKYKGTDTRRLYTSGSGWPIIEESQFHVTYEPRIQRWGEGLNSTINSTPPSTERDYAEFVGRYEQPVIAHEIGQWCVFPDFDEMAKYTGHLKPRNFEIFRDLLERSGQGHMAREFLMSSGRLQVLCYKEEVEAALRTPGYGGFQLLDLHDFPGQGTALVGVLDTFWDPKPYVSAEEWRAFCGPVTPLARLQKRVFTSGETLVAALEVAQFGAEDIVGAAAAWSLETSGGRRLAGGALRGLDLRAGALHELGEIRVDLDESVATRATLRVEIGDGLAANSWDVWIFPDETPAPVPSGITVARDFGEEAVSALRGGGTVLLSPPAEMLEGDVAFGFSPVFWNTAWTDNQPPHTLGVHVDTDHPIFGHFPTGHHTDWQWWDLIGYPGARGGAMVIDALPGDIEPVVRPIDTWFRSRRLACLFEARVGSGRLLVCSFDLDTDLAERPAARRFRDALFRYLDSDAFAPDVRVDEDDLLTLFRTPTLMERLGAVVHEASSAESGYPAELAIDGDPGTMWHSSWTDGAASHPHELTVSFADPIEIAGIAYTPRQSGGENGMISGYEILTSEDGVSWSRAARGTLNRGTREQEIRFEGAVTAKSVRIRSLSAVNGSRYAAIAEIRPLLP